MQKKKALAVEHTSSFTYVGAFNSRFTEEFEEITKLGQGAFGVVFKARKKIDKQPYAVKRIKMNGKDEKKLQEVLALADLNHIGIVRYYQAWIETPPRGWQEEQDSHVDGLKSPSDGSSAVPPTFLYIQTELCKAETLKNWLCNTNKTKNRPSGEILKILREITSALAYIHDKNIIHRDLKPENIFFSEFNSVKVGDFGVARMMAEDHAGSLDEDVAKSLTENIGTYIYMSPEQKGKHYTNKVDIFALGMIVFQMSHFYKNEDQEVEMIWAAKDQKIPAQLQVNYHALWYHEMLSHNPDERPTAQGFRDSKGPSEELIASHLKLWL